MRTLKYKLFTLFVLLFAILQAQKFDKKITEKFNVNENAVIEINADQTDVSIETWKKDEVAIEAVIEVEGITKEEAEKLFKQWNFEALANKNKVKITALPGYGYFDFDADFTFDFPELEIPYFEMPDIEFPEINFPEIELPELNIEFSEFDYEKYKSDSTYLKFYKQQIAKDVEQFKNSDWKKKLDSFRNSKEYKNRIEEFKAQVETLKNSEEFKKSIEASKEAAEIAKAEILKNRDEILEQAKLAKAESKKILEEVKKMKEEGKLDSIHGSNESIYFFNRTKNSKLKIKRYLKIKVPEKATFELKVRHGNLNIPNSNTKMSANLSYGNFIGGIILGSKNDLKFNNSPVEINSLNAGNVTLKDVPNAKFGTFNKANLFSNSSDVIINEVGENVALSQKFGKLIIKSSIPNFTTLNVILDYAKADINLSKSIFKYQINTKKSTLNLPSKFTTTSNKTVDNIKMLEGFSTSQTSQNKLFLTAIYSSVTTN